VAAHRTPGPVDQEQRPLRIDEETTCRWRSPTPGPTCTETNRSYAIGGRSFDTGSPKGRIRILGFDGAKVHDFLFHVALAEIQWQDLYNNPQAAVDSVVPKHRAMERAASLYDSFLEVCRKGPNQAIAFLAEQHALQKKYLQQSLAILQTVQRQIADNQILLSKLAFGAQAVKSTATAALAIVGLFLAGPEIVAGAGVVIGYDVAVEIVKRIGSSNESTADTVVVGFKQTVANDFVSAAGSKQQVSLEASKDVLQRTLNYPQKSSIYRSVVTTGAQVDMLLKSLGVISAGVTLYTEWKDARASYEHMQKINSSH
jgi:hypothetical protein